MMRTPLAALAAALLLLSSACGPERYEAKGRIVEVRADLGQVMIDHEDIPGLMPAMTMNFDVDPEVVQDVAAGDEVRFRISRTGESFRVVTIAKVGAAGQAGRSSGGGADAVGLSDVAPAEAEARRSSSSTRKAPAARSLRCAARWCSSTSSTRTARARARSSPARTCACSARCPRT